MSDAVLERLISSYLEVGLPHHVFTWQGGEPTLMGLEFFRRVIELQKKYGKPGQVVANALQTNGILLDERWCGFLAENKFLVGISLDGPGELHDYYRLDRTGKGTFEKVMFAIENCRKYRVEFNVLVLLNDRNIAEPDRIFDFLLENRFKYWQFIPCVESDAKSGKIASFSITPKQYGDFLCRIFDRWNDFGPEKISIRMFDSILSYLAYGAHTICTFARRCDDYFVVEHNGDAFCCDFFVGRQWKIGSILETPVKELICSTIKHQFAEKKRRISNKCLICRHKNICRGGCLKERMVINGDYSRTSYFCESYRQFFDYALPRFMQMTAQ